MIHFYSVKETKHNFSFSCVYILLNLLLELRSYKFKSFIRLFQQEQKSLHATSSCWGAKFVLTSNIKKKSIFWDFLCNLVWPLTENWGDIVKLTATTTKKIGRHERNEKHEIQTSKQLFDYEIQFLLHSFNTKTFMINQSY